MKNRFALLLLLSFVSNFVLAQDTIFKRNNDKLIVKITEINPTEIKYKRFDFQDGPTYVESKETIKMIVFSNGMKEVFEEKIPAKKETTINISDDDYVANSKSVSNKIETWGPNRYGYKNMYLNEREMQEVLMDSRDKKIMGLVTEAKQAKKMQYVGFAGIPFGIAAYGLLLYGLVSSPSWGYPSMEPQYAIGAAACGTLAIASPIVSGAYKKKRNSNNRAAVKLYNQKF